MPIKPILELIAAGAALACFAVAARALVQFIHMNRTVKRQLAMENTPQPHTERHLRRAS